MRAAALAPGITKIRTARPERPDDTEDPELDDAPCAAGEEFPAEE